MALSSDFPGVYTECCCYSDPDFDAIANKLRQNSSSYLCTYSVTNSLKLHRAHYYWVAALLSPYVASAQVVSVVMKYAENTVKTSVALLLTTVVSVYLFNFHVSLAFLLGSSKLTAFASVNTINLTFSHKIA
ncbi:unnamed protein product [Brassica oleracea]|uniref:(rape) hypothetical protein n=1 Tax=Brassica napus TaxID=3708 RepID=A0A816IMX5_BRANA|nr:unnamed protein product [Brassica napus]